MIFRCHQAVSFLVAVLAPFVRAVNDTALTGTWTTKSNTVVTGPGFYDPIDELLYEPSLPGLSMSFTDDGYYEEAFYYVISEPANPTCPTALLQFQHGTYEIASNGSILLKPFAVDGRQLLSDPCTSDESVYSRYSQFEIYSEWDITRDDYRGQYKLQLYKFDGYPMNPMYLVYRPPLMLPTITMNPTASDTPAATATSEAKAKSRLKRSFENRSKTDAIKRPVIDATFWWWVAMMMMIGGGGAFLCLQRQSMYEKQ
ncbi:chaperone for protein-folding within the ER, fungal-domain-containing protein [Lipomyces tetrasporus]|uniref:Protein ROT1 n=1 Tax=Lipomyces tetrasporus TaxID=54092 RepID=A0AAD7QXC2_9ASCO|nr:chaperone for protein-folding within the ER, fungal-domain-containing protein [Lipomyces tetrasporus]KAJ8102991.1 chaperone for protein-folding within the ER, fungal-domain-containing protein [Lipomyces tetrasporus]